MNIKFNLNSIIKDWRWWSYVFILISLISSLIYGFYYCVLKEYWYVSETSIYASLLNYDALMSFFSVQVTIITIVWLLLFVIKSYRNQKIIESDFQISVINYNLLVFIIFWVGIIYSFANEKGFLENYSKNQVICTSITHFFLPTFLLVLYPFTAGNKYIDFKKIFKEKTFYKTMIYPIFYLFYILVRGKIYQNDKASENSWPYDFLNFDKLLIGNSLFGYIILLVLVFFIWLILHHWLIISINNLIYKKRKKIEKS